MHNLHCMLLPKISKKGEMILQWGLKVSLGIRFCKLRTSNWQYSWRSKHNTQFKPALLIYSFYMVVLNPYHVHSASYIAMCLIGFYHYILGNFIWYYFCLYALYKFQVFHKEMSCFEKQNLSISVGLGSHSEV